MSSLLDLRLVPRDDSDDETFKRGNMTIHLDDNGNPSTISGLAALEQDVLKAVFTGQQPDGYGTAVHRVVGTKNLGVVRAMTVYSVVTSLQKLARIHKNQERDFPTQFRGQRVLESAETMVVDQITPVSLRIRADLRNRQNELFGTTMRIQESTR